MKIGWYYVWWEIVKSQHAKKRGVKELETRAAEDLKPRLETFKNNYFLSLKVWLKPQLLSLLVEELTQNVAKDKLSGTAAFFSV